MAAVRSDAEGANGDERAKNVGEEGKAEGEEVRVRIRSRLRMILQLACEHLAVVAVALVSFWGALDGDLVFDDVLAITSNPDTDPGNPDWRQMMLHDFWGAPITSTSSHKSYRPLTTASFRLTRVLNGLLGRASLDPRLFHLENVVLHAVCSVLVHRMALSVMGRRHNFKPALVAALLFAAHPVHRESVASAVGRADLLCTIFGIGGYLLWEAASQPPDRGRGRGRLPTARVLAFRLGGFVLVALSTLCKEIGITWILFLAAREWVSILARWRRPCAASRNSAGGGSGGGENRSGGGGGASREEGHRDRCESPVPVRQLGRSGLCLGLPVAAYILFRKWLMGDAITIGFETARRAENPVANSTSLKTRLLSKAQLHALYAKLLIWPHPLSPDYSFDCIPLVETLLDSRNLLSVVAYSAVIALACTIFATLFVWPGSLSKSSSSWILASSVAILTFLPASGLLVDPGTMLAERLLYMPSIGFCLLMAMFLDAIYPSAELASGGHPDDQPDDKKQDISPAPPRNMEQAVSGLISSLAPLAPALLMVGAFVHASRTETRHWSSEKALFEAAHRVCPRSVKVLLNLGILRRREERWLDAIELFDAAARIDETFCDPSYWSGITLLHIGDINAGMGHLWDALGCKYNFLEAVKALQASFSMLRANIAEDMPLLSHTLYEYGERLSRHGLANLALTPILQAGVNYGQLSLNGQRLQTPPATAVTRMYGFDGAVILGHSNYTSLAYTSLKRAMEIYRTLKPGIHDIHGQDKNKGKQARRIRGGESAQERPSILGPMDECSLHYWHGYASLAVGKIREAAMFQEMVLRGFRNSEECVQLRPFAVGQMSQILSVWKNEVKGKGEERRWNSLLDLLRTAADAPT